MDENVVHEEPLKEKTDAALETPLPEPVPPPAAPKKKRSSRDAYGREEFFMVPSQLFEDRGRILSIINQKGGCGKTTTAINLGASLAREGFEVLLIDLDPQANATLGLGIRLEPTAKTAYELFKEPNLPSAELIHATSMDHLRLIAGSRHLASLAVELMKAPNWEYSLRSYVRSFRQDYHFILIDCPPALNALTVNALTASSDMIIPLQTHYFSLEGLKELFLTVQSVRQTLNPHLAGGRILPTLFDKRTRVNREMLESLRDYFKEQVFETVIGVSIRLVESVMHGMPVLMYDPGSAGARDYRYLCWELLEKEAALKAQGGR